MQLPGRNQNDGTAGSPGNPTGRIRIEGENFSAQNGIQTENCGDVGGTLDVGYIDPGDAISYDVALPVSGTYTINFRLANDDSPSTFQLRNSNGTVLATINVPYTGGWQNYVTIPATATLPAGQQTLQLYCTANHWNINWLELLPPATGSGGFNGSGAYHIEAEDFISQNGTLLENCQDAGGTYNIGSINTGDWLDYRVNMPVGGSYQLSVRAASANSGSNTLQLLSATGTVLATININNTGSYQTFSTFTANVSLPAGVQTLRLAVTGGYLAVNWLELAAPNSTVPLDNYALVLNNNYNGGGLIYEAENTFTVEFMVKPHVAHEIDQESTGGTVGTSGQKYVLFPVYGGSAADSRAGMGISVGTNGVSVYEHADSYMPALLVWEYPIDTVWTHVAVVYHNGKPSLYINGVWKKDGLQSLKQHVYPGTQFPGGYYGSQGDGILDEVRIWSVARTEAQIAANKDGELTGPQTGLVGYWPMNEGTGLVLHDVSGSGRDVDLTSAGYTSASWTNGRYSVASITGSYRYGFNGKEKDGDIDEDDYDYGMRIHDARLGRFLSIDPLTRSYPMLTPYQFATNSPIAGIDLDGLEFESKVKDATDFIWGVMEGFFGDFRTAQWTTCGTEYERFRQTQQAQVRAANADAAYLQKYGIVKFTLDKANTIWAELKEVVVNGTPNQRGRLVGGTLALATVVVPVLGESKMIQAAEIADVGILGEESFMVSNETPKLSPNAAFPPDHVPLDYGTEPMSAGSAGEIATTDAATNASVNRGLGTTTEKANNSPAQAYENTAEGASSNLATGRRNVPTLLYDNPNPQGNNYIKFDGFESETSTFIDRKLNVTTYPKSIDQINRAAEALSQNPTFNLRYEVPPNKYNSIRNLLRRAGQDTNPQISIGLVAP